MVKYEDAALGYIGTDLYESFTLEISTVKGPIKLHTLFSFFIKM